MDAVGIIKDDELNREKANEMGWATSEDTLDECVKEVTGKWPHEICKAQTNFTNYFCLPFDIFGGCFYVMIVSDRTNPCEKAYFLTRCVMMRNIVDMRTTGNQ